MLQSTGLQRVGHNLATEQQQKFCKALSALPVQIKCSVIASYLFFCYYYHGAIDDNKSRNTQAVFLCIYLHCVF